jgi:hypothetical protein
MPYSMPFLTNSSAHMCDSCPHFCCHLPPPLHPRNPSGDLSLSLSLSLSALSAISRSLALPLALCHVARSAIALLWILWALDCWVLFCLQEAWYDLGNPKTDRCLLTPATRSRVPEGSDAVTLSCNVWMWRVIATGGPLCRDEVEYILRGNCRRAHSAWQSALLQLSRSLTAVTKLLHRLSFEHVWGWGCWECLPVAFVLECSLQH